MATAKKGARGKASQRREAGLSTVPPTRARGAETATGAALRQQAEGDESIPKGKERGSQTPIDNPPKPDAEAAGQKPVGLQAQPARFTSNGSLEEGMVPSASGPVPMGAVTTSAEDAKRRLAEVDKAHKDFLASRHPRRRIPEGELRRLGRPEVRAIGTQRGYDIPDAGTRATTAAFLAAQEKDKTLIDAEDEAEAP